ncbi:DUF5686 and carboxypeptidase-like regulatory domain-containing protein [Aquimarina intermedia]|uniref:Carboxypeptidase-like protein n=1 Tax=Aquimarina intermedia TaxID=350814 RepID=A0A5S5CCJ3_9FLAO|nr:DUF5686 and carboxypeptidase-like regulatory domain-containing protein [Aquimarina intermedia]TYP76056.1 carboxypeptidase-like protein [Aquimarina intermedia]
MQIKLFSLFFFCHLLAFSQLQLSGKIQDSKTNAPLPFATISINNVANIMTSSDGSFTILATLPVTLTVSYLGYLEKKVTITDPSITYLTISMSSKTEKLGTVSVNSEGNRAHTIISKAIENKLINDPKKSIDAYTFKSYEKFKITEDRTARLKSRDTADAAIENIFNKTHSFLSEKVTAHYVQKNVPEKQKVLGTKMAGFEQPVYPVLGKTIQSSSLYGEEYTIFNERFAGPLSKKSSRLYYYKILDTLDGNHPAYVVLFQPTKTSSIARLEGLLYIDTTTYAIQKAILELKGELDIKATHLYKKSENNGLWLPENNSISIKSGNGKQKISLFGGRISVGNLDQKNNQQSNDDFLLSKTDFFDYNFEPSKLELATQPAILVDTEAENRDNVFWESYRTAAITEKDLASFPVIDSIVKAQHIERRINVIQSFNQGFYPLGFFNLDLTYPIKYNNYEGLRLGLGGITNSSFSQRFRIEGYTVYGFIDDRFKYGIGGGILLNKKHGAWLNFNFKDDLSEVGSFQYLTDRRVYSLFEPRLVNIDFYYKHRTYSTSLQYELFPKLLSETQISLSEIDQTKDYQYKKDDIWRSSYKNTEAKIALRWSPFSNFLKTPSGTKEIYDGYPKFTAQYTQGISDVFESDLTYSKVGLKAEYNIDRLNLSTTSFLLEGNLGFGELPLTHLFHAYPNAPTKETILQRFSVAGRRSFETMYFSEFFSDKLATFQMRHTFQPIRIASWLQPELVLISRHAIGTVRDKELHQGIEFKSLEHGYQESGFEVNKLIAGFGLSFAFRYGAYSLPQFEDNIAFKFTFYLKL